MKKILSVLLVFAMLLAAFPFINHQVSAAMPSPSVINGYENVCLAYTYHPGLSTYGCKDVSEFLPYVGYYNESGKMTDFFFDSYLFLPYNTTAPSGAKLHGGTNSYTIASDWTDYVEKTFSSGENVDALDAAMETAKNTLNSPNEKAGVFFSILYPNYNKTSFGTLGGRSLNFSRRSDRNYAIKWIIDEQLSRFNDAEYKNLELVGFLLA